MFRTGRKVLDPAPVTSQLLKSSTVNRPTAPTYSAWATYTVKPADHNNADDTKLETIFCAFQQPEGVAFNSSAIEKRIAHLNNLNDVAKASGSGIHFHGHRFQTKFSSVLIPQNSLLPFEIYLNMGGAFHENVRWRSGQLGN